MKLQREEKRAPSEVLSGLYEGYEGYSPAYVGHIPSHVYLISDSFQNITS